MSRRRHQALVVRKLLYNKLEISPNKLYPKIMFVTAHFDE